MECVQTPAAIGHLLLDGPELALHAFVVGLGNRVRQQQLVFHLAVKLGFRLVCLRGDALQRGPRLVRVLRPERGVIGFDPRRLLGLGLLRRGQLLVQHRLGLAERRMQRLLGGFAGVPVAFLDARLGRRDRDGRQREQLVQPGPL